MTRNDSEYSPDYGLLSPNEFLAVTTVLVLSGVLGFMVNSLTICVFVKVSELRSPTNVFIIALTICDLTMSVLGIPFSVVSSACNRWMFGKVGCTWYGFLMAFMGYTSIFLLTAISVERYILITNPFSGLRITSARALLVTMICLLLAFTFSILPVVGWSSYTLEAALISCSVNWKSNAPNDVSYIVTVFALCLLLPVVIMVFSYLNVFRTVHTLARNPMWGKNSHVTKKNLSMEYRTTRNILFIIGAFLLSWTPYAVVSFWSAFGNPHDITPLAGTLPALIAKSSIVWNPMIYVLTNRDFRIRLVSMLTDCCPSIHSANINAEVNFEMESIQKSEEYKKPNYLAVTFFSTRNGKGSSTRLITDKTSPIHIPATPV